MENRKMQISWRILAGCLPILFATVVVADRPAMRVAPEVSTEGITVEESYDRQVELHERLTAALPDRTLSMPITVEITQQDRANMTAPHANGTPLKIGVVKTVRPAVETGMGKGLNRGVIEENADGSFTWTLAISSPDAEAIRVHFRAFSLPDGAELYILNDLGEARGPYVAQGRNNDGDFWTHSVSSDTAVLMVTYPGQDKGQVRFVIDQVGHIGGRPPTATPQAWSDDYCGNPSCVVDANCGSVSPASQDAIAKYEWIAGRYIYTCTGGLIADTDGSSQRNLFLTANHCMSRGKDAKNVETFFHYTTSSCNGACPAWPSASDTVGASILAHGGSGDYSLLELNENPPSGTTFLGWNNSPIAFTDGADLHRVSNPNYGPQVYSHHQVDTQAGTCTSLPRGQIIYSNDVEGATDGGSSGSPVVNSSGEIVGQLYGCCGYNCANACDAGSNSTVDGALAFYYPNVAEFLNPVGCTPVTEVCDNGTDDDCDGDVDCADADCSGDPACSCTPVTEVCDNGSDDDCDGDVDCNDADCSADPACNCTLAPLGDPCVDNADCCSNKCKGRSGRKTCK